jgi:hypothetical protein
LRREREIPDVQNLARFQGRYIFRTVQAQVVNVAFQDTLLHIHSSD